MMRHEACLLRRLRDSSNVIHTYGVVFSNANPVVILEYSEIGNLQAYLQDKPNGVCWDQKLKFCLDAVNGVKAIHEKKLVHGDLKASNILLFENADGSLTAKISDLGYSYALSTKAEDCGGGTFNFQAPERTAIRHSPGNEWLKEWVKRPAQDLYSVGLVIWQIAMDGEVPYKRSNQFDDGGKMDDMLNELPKLLNSLKSYLESTGAPLENLTKIITHAAQFNPKDRASLDEIISCLKNALNDWASNNKNGEDDKFFDNSSSSIPSERDGL